MRNGPSFVRFLVGACCAFVVGWAASAATAQTIDLSLNVLYEDAEDPDSGGTWELVAKSSGSGIEQLSVRLAGIDPTVEFEAPRGTVGSLGAGFSILANLQLSNHRNLVMGQNPRPSGQQQTVFYGVGTITNGEPGDVGPALPSLTNPVGIPWAVEPDPMSDPFDDPAWDTAATFATGTFAAGLMPGFFPGSTGQIFTTVGTSTMYGNIAMATITALVRDNLSGSLDADYNANGVVDAADYVLWRKNPSMYGGDPAGYDAWRAAFGSTGGSGSSVGVTPVPEPASAALAAAVLGFAVACRRPRSAASRQRPSGRAPRAKMAAVK